MTPATRGRGRRITARAPSTRYLNLATDGGALIGGGRSFEIFPRILVPEVRVAAGEREAVVWVHESAHERLGIPRDRLAPDHAELVGAALGVTCRGYGSDGWLVVNERPEIHLAFPAYLSDFAGTGDVAELLDAVEAWRTGVGLTFLFSGASTLHTLIRTTVQLPDVVAEPVLEPGYAGSAWAIPGNSWHRELTGDELACPWVRAFDRSGSFLAAWRGVNLAAGEWQEIPGGVLEAGPESELRAGYWLVELPAFTIPALPDPWRRHGDVDGLVWLTTPLLQLLRDVDGLVRFERAWVTADACRALDAPAARIAAARDTFAGTPAALRALKAGYARATNWLEHGPPAGEPLHRPHWRRTVVDRHAANTWRALYGAGPAPFGLCDVDTALFAVPGPDDAPKGLRLGTGLGAWKPKGRPLPMLAAAAALVVGGPRAVVALAEST